jgi:membrane-associated phospholipid phosphatase
MPKIKKNSLRVFVFFAFACAFAPVFSQNADIDLLKRINLDRNRGLDPTFLFFTNTAEPICIASPIVVFGLGLIEGDSSLKHKGFYMAETIVATTILATGLKYAVNRPRPFVTYPFIQKETDGGSPSFPSGHASVSFATATSLSIAFPKWYVIAPAFLWAGITSYSRMDLGVHYPSDVLAGAVIGSGSAWLCEYLNRRFMKKSLIL